MTLRPLIAILATALLGGTALAAPALKADVSIAAAVVTVGDMFDDAGALATQPLFRAPQPGTTGTVPLAAVTAAAARIGLDDFDARGLQSVRVIREAAIVDEAMFSRLIAADLAGRGIITQGMSAQTIFSTAITPITAEAVAEPATLLSLRYLPGTGAFSARFAISGIAKPLDLTGTLDLMLEAPHLAANLPAGTILTPDHIVMRQVPLKFAESAGFAAPEQLVGKQLQRQSREGMLLKPADVAEPQLISRNDIVTIYFRQGPMTLTVKGQALSGAANGGPLQVLNLMSKRVISATALAAGAVEVSNDPLTLAGL